MFKAIFERELGDAGFIELAEAFGDHAGRTVPLWRAREADRGQACAHSRHPLSRWLIWKNLWRKQTSADQVTFKQEKGSSSTRRKVR